MTSELSVSRQAAMSVLPQNMDEVIRLAEMMAGSEMVPKNYQGKPGNVVVAILAGLPVGLSPFVACQSFAVINGMPSLFGDAPLAIVRGSGYLKNIKETFENGTATCSVWRAGEDEPVVRRFTLDDAKRAGLLGKQGPWQTNPTRMCQMRARAFALRDTFPDILRGIGLGEEQQDKELLTATAETETAAESKAAAVLEALKKRSPQELIDESLAKNSSGGVGAKLEAGPAPVTREAETESTVPAKTRKTASKASVKKAEKAEAAEDETPETTPETAPLTDDELFLDEWREKLRGLRPPLQEIAVEAKVLWAAGDREGLEELVKDELYAQPDGAQRRKVGDFIDACAARIVLPTD